MRSTLFGLTLVLAAFQLRPAITSVAASLDQTTTAFQLSPTEVSLLAAVPVLTFALAAPLGPHLARRFGTQRAMAYLLTLIAAGLVLRATARATMLPGTVIVAAGITGVSILAPEVIKRRFSGRRLGLWTGLFTLGFSAGAALGAYFAIPLIDAFHGRVSWGLAAWAIPAGLCAVLLLVQNGDTSTEEIEAEDPPPTRSNQSQAWSLTWFFGMQALIYFSVTAWLPTVYESRGLPPQQSAALLSWLSAAGFLTTLLTPVLAARMHRQRAIGLVICILTAIGLVGVMAAPVGAAILWVGVLGLAQSGAFALAITLIILRSQTPADAARHSAHAQGIGYAIAAGGALAVGILHQHSHGWVPVLLLLLGCTAVEATAAWRSGIAANVSGSTHSLPIPAMQGDRHERRL